MNLSGWLQPLLWMIKKELLSTIKDPKTRFILVVPVILQSLVFGYVATYELDKVPYALLDMSHSQASREFIAKIDGSTAFYREKTLANPTEIASGIDNGEVMLTVVIPQDFAVRLSRGETADIQVIADGRNTMTAALATGYINSIVQGFNEARNPLLNVISLETIVWYNPNLITRWGFLPALVAMLGLVQVLMLGGLSVAREREQGTFDQLLVTPLSATQILIGKAIAPILIGLFQSTLILLICIFGFNIPLAGSIGAIYVTISAFLLSCTGLGLSISAISRTMQQVMVYCFVLLMPMVLLSGLTTPVANMPKALQIVTYIDPLRFALDAIRRIYLEGASLADVGTNFIPLLILAAITLPLAGKLFRMNTD